MQWLQEAFLGYLTKWRASVTSRDGFTLADKALMPLSRETEGGLFMTGMCICMQCVMVMKLCKYMHSHLTCCVSFMLIVRSFLERTKFLLEQPTIHDKGFYILSACFNQDLLQSYFGNVRAAERRNVNPSVREVLSTADTLRLQVPWH